MDGGCEERIVEVEVAFREHPLVVLFTCSQDDVPTAGDV